MKARLLREVDEAPGRDIRTRREGDHEEHTHPDSLVAPCFARRDSRARQNGGPWAPHLCPTARRDRLPPFRVW